MGSAGPCHRCGRGGHLARDCKLHTCFRCNGRGHMAWECVEGITCSRCGEKGHLQRNCKSVSCHKCKKKGHIAKFCKDPFAKAAEAEMKERQLAGFLERQSSLQNPVSEDEGGAPSGIIKRLSTPSAWDGLGVLKTGLSTRVKGNLDSGGSSPKQDIWEKSSFKILGLKRKQSTSIESRASKLKGYTLGNSGNTLIKTNESGDVTCLPTAIPNYVENDEIKSWHGLVGYGSEESKSDDEFGSYTSSAKENEARNEFQGEVETRSKDVVCPSVDTDIHGLIDEKISIRDSINEGTVVDETGAKGDQQWELAHLNESSEHSNMSRLQNGWSQDSFM